MKNINIYYILAGLFFFSCDFQRTNPETEKEAWISYTTPENAGFSPDSLAGIDRLIKDYTDKNLIPGAVALVAKDGKIIYQTAYGYKDVEAQEPLDTTDVFRIASMTKPIVSTAIMQLYENGSLKLDDPLSKFIPSFKDPQVLTSFNASDTTWESVTASREITIHDLLTHTSGISYGFADQRMSAIYAKSGIPDLAVASDKTIEVTMDSLGNLPLLHHPGERFSYGLNTDVLGRVVEVVTDMALNDYINQKITGPLRMNDTRFFYEEGYSKRLVTVYQWNPSDSAIHKMDSNGMYHPDYPIKGKMSYYSGGSGMSSTLKDYFIFGQTILNGGKYKGVRILKDSTVQLMLSEKLGNIRWSEDTSFGYGWLVETKTDNMGNKNAVQLGWSGAFNTYFWINPSDNVVGIIMSQVLFSPFGQKMHREFKEVVEDAY